MNDRIRRGCVGCGAVGLVLVVGVVVVYPWIERKREERQNQGSCLSNMREIGKGLQQYVGDYDGALPPAAPSATYTWRSALISYLEPNTVLTDPDRDTPAAVGPDGYSSSYAVNASGSGKKTGARGPFASGVPTITTKTVSTPAKVIALCEVQGTTRPAFDLDDPSFGPSPQTLFAGHDGHSSYLFLDGHAESLAPQQTAGPGMQNLWYVDGSPLSTNGATTLTTTQHAFGQ